MIYGLQSGAGDIIALSSGASEKFRITNAGDVGIGTISPGGYKLAVGDGSSNRGRIMLKGATSGNYPEINIDDSMNTSGKNYQIYSTGGHLKVSNQTDNAVSFVANAFGIGLADNAPVDGDGIRFPATQSASSNANTLDDYEEGTWLPTIASQSGSFGSVTYNAGRAGYYTKIGRVVTISALVWVSSYTTGTASGQMRISSLPFPIADFGQNFAIGNLSQYGGNGYTPSLSTANVALRCEQAQSYAVVFIDTNSAHTDETVAQFSTGGFLFRLSATYITST
jgi:hypothetical protein